MGSYDEAPDSVSAWLEAGADAIDLVLPLGLPEEQLHEMLEATAPAAAPGEQSGRWPRASCFPQPGRGPLSSPSAYAVGAGVVKPPTPPTQWPAGGRE